MFQEPPEQADNAVLRRAAAVVWTLVRTAGLELFVWTKVYGFELRGDSFAVRAGL